jgi:hypothetical protein
MHIDSLHRAMRWRRLVAAMEYAINIISENEHGGSAAVTLHARVDDMRTTVFLKLLGHNQFISLLKSSSPWQIWFGTIFLFFDSLLLHGF